MSDEQHSRSVVLAGGGRLSGDVEVPGDKSISHRALMLGSIAHGTTTIENLSSGTDVLSTMNAMMACGALVKRDLDSRTVTVQGGSLRDPASPIDMGNAGTGIRLLTGLIAGAGIYAVLFGDASLSKRPMDRVIEPLSNMGARIISRAGRFAPLVNVPTVLNGIEHESQVASAQVKSAILLAGLNAKGPTRVVEPVISRRHTEDMLEQFGASIHISDNTIELFPGELTASVVRVPGDPSQAAFWAVGASIAPDSRVSIPNIELSPERNGFLRVLKRMGANIAEANEGLVVTYEGRLKPTNIPAAEVASLIDEVPVLAVAAATADGTSTFYGLRELTVKESNRLEGIAALLTGLGAPCKIDGDTLTIDGVSHFVTASSRSRGDHRMTMAAAIASLLCIEPSELQGTEFVETSYPGFFVDLERLLGHSEVPRA